MSLNRATATVDMSPEAILSRLKIVDELNHLCRILGQTSIPDTSTDLRVAESPTAIQNANVKPHDSATDEHR